MRSILIALVLIALASPTLAAKRIALLIGNQDYKRGVGKLANPLNDIRLVGTALRKVGFEVLEPVRNGTRADILDAIDKYTAKLKAADTDAIGFIYYSGHGIASRGVNYLIPVDVDRPSTRLLRADGVKQSEVLTILRQEAPNAAHYVVIDACRNELKGARGAKGFLPVNQQSGTLIAFATAPGQTASDLGATSGPYARALAAELVRPGVDDLNMFHRVKVAVSKATGGDQIPWTLDGIQREQRPFFAGKPKQNSPFSNALTARLKRINEAGQAWEKIAGSKDRKILQEFAKLYPGTGYDAMALAKLASVDQKIIKRLERNWLKRQREKPSRPAITCNGVNVKVATGETVCLKPGSGRSFKDCPTCPEMVIVPAGKFTMGSPTREKKRVKGETQVQVSISQPFAVGKFEVTFAEWDACVADGGCSHKLKDSGWGRGRRPVMNVSWEDITKQYLPWLSRKTGKTYRLPSESEWEYVARAGTRTPFWWGASITPSQANYDGNYVYGPGGRKGKYRKQSLPVGSFRPNPWGLYDVHGNVFEWTEDCWNESNTGNPGNGSARNSGDCARRVLRGGSWSGGPRHLRSAYRIWNYLVYRSVDYIGFRVVRMLTP
jgi:formylglycine-generating enzyme required for sulfatase activity